jgi:hypothetical protein
MILQSDNFIKCSLLDDDEEFDVTVDPLFIQDDFNYDFKKTEVSMIQQPASSVYMEHLMEILILKVIHEDIYAGIVVKSEVKCLKAVGSKRNSTQSASVYMGVVGIIHP